ncbi:MFS transporter [Candidatus Saccharibacteria bacterium]|nr:MFS transporter [Candidatus Saccharibacteria bacterium]
MKKSQLIKDAKRNLRLVMAESTVTAALLCMAVMTPFFNSIGLNNEQISLTQVIFTIVVLVLNIPTGYIADRISRKWANIIGDFVAGIALLFYATIGSFMGAVICEIVIGVAKALSGGVDQSLLKHFSGKLAEATNESESRILKSKTAKLQVARFACNIVLLALGGPIGAIDLRLAIALSSVNQFVGGIISFFIDDDSEKLVPTHKNPMKDMARVTKNALKLKPLRWRIFAYAVSKEMTHGIVWIVTPLFMQAGVPLSVVSLAWAFNAASAMVGAELARRFSHKLTDAQTLALPTALMVVSMLVMGINLNIITVWFYILMGIVQGWVAGTVSPMVQRYTKPSEQTSVLSLAMVISSLLYIPVVWLIGYVADMRLEYGLFATIAIFLPLSIITILKIKKNA